MVTNWNTQPEATSHLVNDLRDCNRQSKVDNRKELSEQEARDVGHREVMLFF